MDRLERVQGQPYMMSQEPIRFWMFVAFAHGLIAIAGVIVTVKHLLTLREMAPSAVAEGRC